MADNKIIGYGIIAVKSSENPITHHHSLSHFFILPETEKGYNYPGKLYSKDEVIILLATSEVTTATWNYSTGRWRSGAKVSTEKVKEITYLRSAPDNTKRDNLTNLIDFDFFKV